MTQAILLEGREYISASRASEKSGYTSDYIGQLCREKRITGRLIGKTWYVEFPVLLAYKKSRKARPDFIIKSPLDKAEIREIALPQRPYYEAEYHPLLPPLSKRKEAIKTLSARLFIRESVEITLALVLFVSMGFVHLEQINPNLALKAEEKMAIEWEIDSIIPDSIPNLSLLGAVSRSIDVLVKILPDLIY